MTDLVAELDRLHEEAVQGKCEMGLNLDYCTKHARRKKPGLGSCGPRKASLMKYAAEMQEAWPTISARVKVLEAQVQAVREVCAQREAIRDTYDASVTAYHGYANACDDILHALDETP